MPCFLVGMAAIGKMAIRSIVLSSRFGLFHLGKWTATKSAEKLSKLARNTNSNSAYSKLWTSAISGNDDTVLHKY